MKKVSTTFFLFIAIFICKPNYLNAQINVQDSLALVDFYNSTGGPTWDDNTNWLTTAPVSTWAGINSVVNNRVIQMYFPYRNLIGTIPASLGNLTALSYLNLEGNYLAGNIPSSLGNLQKLRYLWLNGNQLTDTIPSSLGNLTSLTSLILEDNKLTGNIPSSLETLHNLTYLDLSANQLSDTIPASLGNLISLIDLRLSSNKLTGNIPPGLGNLKKLKVLSLSFNKLSGKIPVNLRNLNIVPGTVNTGIDLSNNNFTFAGMERAVQRFQYDLTYYDQASIKLHKNGNILSVSAGGELAHNTYHWFKNGASLISKKGDSTLTINSSGAYYVKVMNSVATELKLSSDTINYTAGNNAMASKMNNNSPISIYPNPAKTNATLSFNANGKYSIVVTDISGKILQTKTGIANKGINIIQLDISKYANGVYLITITDEKNKRQTSRLSKE